MVRDDDDVDLEDASRNASMLQSKSLMANNVITKRKEQLHRWESSEMNGEPAFRRKKPRVQFQDSDIFLSACMSGDEEEVEDWLGKGADINTSTVDGLTALHQSVIDSKPEMVRFLCEKGADVNAQDNEGWTPLHAAACCGNLAIVKYLCQNGADLAIINSDKELAVDLADDESCREFLELEYRRQGVDPEQCRDQELSTMMRDAQSWMRDGHYGDRPHPRTGASAMHVSAAKGYTQLLELLIKAGGNVRAADKDGWTPLHAAAHWAERDSCKILLEHGASVSDLNFAGQNVLAVADKDVVEYLEDLERTVDKKRSPVAPSTNILQEKNNRVLAGHVHEEHTISSEQKREMQHRDQSSEKETMHTVPKVPRLSEKSPSVESTASNQSQEESRRSGSSVSASEDERLPSTLHVEPRLLASQDERESETPSTTRSSEERSSVSVSDRSSVSADRSASDRAMSVDSQRSSTASTTASGSGSGTTTTSRTSTSATSSSLQSGDQNVSCTVPMPRPLQQPSSWINRGVQLITRSTSSSGGSRSSATPSESSTSAASTTSSSAAVPSIAPPTIPVTAPPNQLLTKPHFVTSPSSVQRSTSTPSNLPWASLCRGGGGSTTSVVSSPIFLSQSRVSAFRPPQKTSASSPIAELPRGMQPQHLNPIKMRPWQSSTINESEAERRSTARLQRQNRRSTQGVTKEQLEEASRIAAEERRRGSGQTASTASVASSGTSQRDHMLARLASEERDSTSLSDRSESVDRNTGSGTNPMRIGLGSRISQERESERSSMDRCSPPTTSATLSLPSAPSPSSTPSAAGLRRKSQGMPLSRSARRGTGPVLAEDVQAASSVTRPLSTALDINSSSSAPYRYTTTNGLSSNTFSRPLISPFSRPELPSRYSGNGSGSDRSDKSQSAPPSNPPPSAPSSAAGLRSAAVAPSPQQRVTSRVAVQPLTTTTLPSSPSYASTYTARPTETNLNYKALYEKEKTESDRLRRELDDLRKNQEQQGNSVSAFRSVTSRFRNGSTSSGGGSTLPISKSASGVSLDDNERRSLERKIADMEIQMKGMGQLRMENQRLKEENGALVRVISKMTI